MDRKLPVLSSSCVCVCVRVSSWITVILKHTWMLLRINSTNWLKTHAGEKLTLLQYTHTHGKWTQTAQKQWNTRTEPRDHGVILQSHTHTHTHTESYRWRLQQVSQMMNLSESPYENTSCSAVTPTHCRFDLFEVNYRKSVYDDVTQPFDRSVVGQEAPHNLTNTKGDDHGLIWREWNAEGAQTFCMDEFSQRMNPDKSGEFTTFPPLVSEMSRQVPWNLAQIRMLPSGWIIKLCWSSEFICDHILEDILIDLSCSAEV